MSTPKTETIVLAAGQTLPYPVAGKAVTVISSTAATFQAAFDNDPFETWQEGFMYPSADGFRQIRFRDSLGAGCTIVVNIADQPVGDNRMSLAGGVLAAMAATLVNILAAVNRLLGKAAATVLADTNVAATGGAGTLLFAASATRRIVEVQALSTNGGTVYVGTTAAVAAANKLAELPAGASWYDEYYQGAVYAVGNDGAQVVCGYAE